MTNLIAHKIIGGGVLQLKRVLVFCPACGQQVEAVARDGQVKGYCAVAKQHVDFRVHKYFTVETRAKMPAAIKERRKR